MTCHFVFVGFAANYARADIRRFSSSADGGRFEREIRHASGEDDSRDAIHMIIIFCIISSLAKEIFQQSLGISVSLFS